MVDVGEMSMAVLPVTSPMGASVTLVALPTDQLSDVVVPRLMVASAATLNA